jgi:hypothetical protein
MRNALGFIIIFITLTNIKLMCQDFSFELVFQDAIGNKDTITLGYDANASDSVDTNFGEVNIISSEIDSIFDVRISDEWNARMWRYDSSGNYHLKKQIINGDCGEGTAISIDIKCKDWPVSATWNSTLFNDTCRSGSVLTSVPPGGWWDVGSPSDLFRAELRNENQVTFSPNWDGYVNENYAYINNQQDTISVFWVVFAKSSFLTSAIHAPIYQDKLNLFPNPTNGKIQISGIQTDQIEQIDLFDISGKKHNINWSSKTMNISNLEDGVYFFQFKLKDKSLITRKMIKN